MLVLSRKTDQVVLIGEDIEIMIVGIENGQVKIGIKAPKEINIQRKELTEKDVEKDLVNV